MVFKKKYGNYYYAKIWKHYKPISKREINTIISRFGRRQYPKSYYAGFVQVNYDETPKSYVPKSAHKSRGSKTIQLAIVKQTILIRELDKPLKSLNRQDILEFKETVSKVLGKHIVFNTDKRFLRLRLSPKDFKLFRREEHNLIHRFIGVWKKKVYSGKEYYKALKDTCKSFGLKLLFL